ncbi:SPOR domain-containing protein [Legionella brunensis]|uniref:Sporulation domain-containing protein n=1 Tax=Legionella brunensis TaxID=29422 RepID=A0A0W0S1S2_9GAMM|nr:SPOR domain-containing protein [Legionella brunensis]KTC77081.1 Sporulation domain-containing protein [Legionella brunensis]
MARDYGKRRQGRQKSSAPKQFLWVVASFLCGYITANVFDFTSLNNWVHKNILAQDEPQPEAKVVAKKENLPKPKFEFYTLLAKDHGPPAPMPRPSLATPAKPALPPQTVPAGQTVTPAVATASAAVPHAPAPVTEAKPLPKNPTKPKEVSKEVYLVQMASFKSKQEAERLKASLILKGFNVSIVAAPPQQGGWFRVILGPYRTRIEAEKIQIAVARSERIKGMVRKLNA